MEKDGTDIIKCCWCHYTFKETNAEYIWMYYVYCPFCRCSFSWQKPYIVNIGAGI
jgi:hypothetical protein